MKIKQNIQQIAIKGFGFLIILVIISFVGENLLLKEIEKNKDKKDSIDNIYNNIYSFKHNTELLLNSYNFIEVKKKWYDSVEDYQRSLDKLLLNKKPHKNILIYHNSIVNKINDIKNSLELKELSLKNNMDKPILVRLGELSVSQYNNEYFITIRDLVDKTEHMKQYQDFLIKELDIIKNKIDLDVKNKISELQLLLILFPVSTVLIIILLSSLIIKFIKRNEAEIINNKNFLENIMNSIPVRIFWKDLDGIYGGANQLFIKDCGLTNSSELIGKSDYDMPWAKTQAKNYRSDDKAIIKSKTSKINIIETQKRKDNTIAHLNTSKVPMLDHENTIIGTIGIYEDITKRVENEKLIKDQEITLIKQSKLAQMGEMISMIAHQWRQPLNVISTISGLIRLKLEDIDKEDIDKKLIKIEEQTIYLSNTIDDFRNFFKPDKIKTDISTKDLVKTTLNIVTSSLESSNIKISTEFHCDHNLYIFKNEVMQVLLNIIKNAQDALNDKDIQNPYINITARCNVNSSCVITIEDNAKGIDEDIIDNIFDPYFSTKDEKNGTGLGLYMSKTIIESHCNGKLEVKNTNDGACFTITLPLS